MARVPASIRYKNPGAMWGSPLAIKWGASRKPVQLNDGTGQNNNIAVFPSFLLGICAQLDLWRTSKHYRNKRLSEALRVWSGGNNVESYINFVRARVPGITRDTVLDDAFWLSPMGIQFLKAQAWHEAGQPYPAPESDWHEARKRVFGGKAPTPEATPAKKTTGAVVAGGGAATAAQQSGLGIGWVIGIGVAFAIAAFLIIHLRKPK